MRGFTLIELLILTAIVAFLGYSIFTIASTEKQYTNEKQNVYIVGEDNANGVVCYKINGSYGISCVKVR